MPDDSKPKTKLHILTTRADRVWADRVCAFLQTYNLARDYHLRVMTQEEFREQCSGDDLEERLKYRQGFLLVMAAGADYYKVTHEKMYTAAGDFEAGYNACLNDIRGEEQAKEKAAEEKDRAEAIKKVAKALAKAEKEKDNERLSFAICHTVRERWVMLVDQYDISRYAERAKQYPEKYVVLGRTKTIAEAEALVESFRKKIYDSV